MVPGVSYKSVAYKKSVYFTKVVAAIHSLMDMVVFRRVVAPMKLEKVSYITGKKPHRYDLGDSHIGAKPIITANGQNQKF